jgi:uncharacterized protein (TIGR00369 family)
MSDRTMMEARVAELLRDPRLTGYQTWEEGHDPFEDHVGPFFYREFEPGKYRCAFLAEAKHCNGGGFMHGGMVMTFADFALFVFARPALIPEGAHAVTVSLTGDFTSSIMPGDFVEATGEIVHAGRSMIFVRGTIFVGERVALGFSGVIKKVRRRPGKE